MLWKSILITPFQHLVDAVTDANNLHFTQRKIWFNSVAATIIRNLNIVGCNSEGDGITTVRASTTDYQSAGTSQDISVPADESVSAAVNTGNLTIAANGFLYLYIHAAGNHQGVMLQFEAEKQ